MVPKEIRRKRDALDGARTKSIGVMTMTSTTRTWKALAPAGG